MTQATFRPQALVPRLISERGNTLFQNVGAVLAGVVVLSALAQISIPLPFTVVPITGQTFGVMLIALLWGQKRGMAAVASYLMAGASGLPVFAGGHAGLAWGPTLGYLFGMFFASVAVGTLADEGWGKSFWKAYFACVLGSVITFTLGLSCLSLFVPTDHLLMAGLWPFLPGDLVKSVLAATLVSRASRTIR